MFHISTQHGGLSQGYAFSGFKNFLGLVKVGSSHQENKIYQGVGQWLTVT